MKKMLPFLFVSLLSTTAFSQAPKGANLILVSGVGYDQVLNALLDKGYFIRKKDTELFTASTEPRRLKNGSNYVIRVRIKDSTAYLSGEVFTEYVHFADEKYVPAVNKGLGGNPEKETFKKVNEFAVSLRGTVDYRKQ